MPDCYDIVIVGAGPAGSSAAIRLARAGFSCLIVEKTRFPRHKLCGEFVSPECLPLLRELGISVAASSYASIGRTVFYSVNGNAFTVPSGWFGDGPALGISRRSLDLLLAQRARDAGVSVVYDSLLIEARDRGDGRPLLKVRTTGNAEAAEYSAGLVINASGRSRAVARCFDRPTERRRAGFVAFKTHLRGALVPDDTCEIYGFRGGYGGCNSVENGLHNVCFIVDAARIKALGSDPDTVFRRCLLTNSRAADVLSASSPETDWLAVPIDGYGSNEPVPARSVIAIGDSAGFIDPFTGSGILLALQTAQIAAQMIIAHRNGEFDDLAAAYEQAHRDLLATRMKISSAFRLAAFSPKVGNTIVRALSLAPGLARRLARSTRS